MGENKRITYLIKEGFMLSTKLVTKKEKILVCITIQHNSKRLIKRGYEIAKKKGGELHILHIAKGESIFTEPESGPLLEKLFEYASVLGGEVHVGCSTDVIQYITSFIKDNHISGIVLGETLRNALCGFFSQNIETCLASKMPNTEIFVLERDIKIAPNPNKIIPV